MDEAAGVRLLERVGNFAGDMNGLRERQPTSAQPLTQRRSGDVLHDEEQQIAVLTDLEDFADIRMIERGNRHRFPAEAFARLRVGRRRRRQHLDGDLPIEAGISSAVHHAHPALTNRREDLIRADAGTCTEHHGAELILCPSVDRRRVFNRA
jgi:hypothetical protein